MHSICRLHSYLLLCTERKKNKGLKTFQGNKCRNLVEKTHFNLRTCCTESDREKATSPVIFFEAFKGTRLSVPAHGQMEEKSMQIEVSHSHTDWKLASLFSSKISSGQLTCLLLVRIQMINLHLQRRWDCCVLYNCQLE